MAAKERRVTVRYIPARTNHYVFAAGSPEDGSLFGLATLCGRLIEDPDQWLEDPNRRLEDMGAPPARMCRQCLRVSS